MQIIAYCSLCKLYLLWNFVGVAICKWFAFIRIKKKLNTHTYTSMKICIFFFFSFFGKSPDFSTQFQISIFWAKRKIVQTHFVRLHSGKPSISGNQNTAFPVSIYGIINNSLRHCKPVKSLGRPHSRGHCSLTVEGTEIISSPFESLFSSLFAYKWWFILGFWGHGDSLCWIMLKRSPA